MNQSLIVGARGQDGRLLNAFLSLRGIPVVTLGRGDFDITDPSSIREILREGIDHVYYLAAHHHSSQDTGVRGNWDLFKRSTEVHTEGLFHFLEAIRQYSPRTRLFYAASSLVFGAPLVEPQNESTPLNPVCFYGITKASGLQICGHFRRTYGVFASGGILFNHESALRERKFVIPKIIHTALEISRGASLKLQLGDLSARVDWGYAPDYVEAMHRILCLENPEDFVIATGETHSVQEVVEMVFARLGLDWKAHVTEAPGILTRKRVVLRGDPSKLQQLTGWRPSIDFQTMISGLVDAAQNA